MLEIGPGTGQATLRLARRGYDIVAVELGAGLAALAARNLAPFPHVRVVNAAFEEWPLPAARFDVVFAAAAFHWLVVTTSHVAGGDLAFFEAAQACYERFMPGTPPDERLPVASTAEYLDLLCTYSGHIALEDDARTALLQCIARLIDERHGGRIAKRYLNELAVAYRAA